MYVLVVYTHWHNVRRLVSSVRLIITLYRLTVTFELSWVNVTLYSLLRNLWLRFLKWFSFKETIVLPHSWWAVSYTHLDVYKRQRLDCVEHGIGALCCTRCHLIFNVIQKRYSMCFMTFSQTRLHRFAVQTSAKAIMTKHFMFI